MGGRLINDSFKTTETLLGIETYLRWHGAQSAFGFKTTETLLGIETQTIMDVSFFLGDASKPLKPF